MFENPIKLKRTLDNDDVGGSTEFKGLFDEELTNLLDRISGEFEFNYSYSHIKDACKRFIESREPQYFEPLKSATIYAPENNVGTKEIEDKLSRMNRFIKEIRKRRGLKV